MKHGQTNIEMFTSIYHQICVRLELRISKSLVMDSDYTYHEIRGPTGHIALLYDTLSKVGTCLIGKDCILSFP